MPDTMIASPAPVLPHTGIPVEIAKAIGEVMTQIKSLPKAEHNAHGGYAFASVDAFMAAVGPLCSGAGLIVMQDEDSIDLMERAGKTWVKMTYSFTLAHTSGVLWNRPTRRTVFQRIDGPQTTGGTQSYALKMYLRALFCIPTGDQDDPDYHPKEAMGGRQEPQGRVQQSRRPDATPKTPQATQQPSSEVIQHIYIPEGTSGLKIGSWATLAKAAMEGQPEGYRRAWLEEHQVEIDEVRRLRPEWADKLEAQAIAPDMREAAE